MNEYFEENERVRIPWQVILVVENLYSFLVLKEKNDVRPVKQRWVLPNAKAGVVPGTPDAVALHIARDILKLEVSDCDITPFLNFSPNSSPPNTFLFSYYLGSEPVDQLFTESSIGNWELKVVQMDSRSVLRANIAKSHLGFLSAAAVIEHGAELMADSSPLTLVSSQELSQNSDIPNFFKPKLV